MSYWKMMCAVAVLTLATGSFAGQTSQAPPTSKGADPVERVTLPNYSVQVLKGPNMQVYEKDCLFCHSARYVITQPGFSRSTWEKEVKKMVDAYGAAVPESDQAKIVDYLVAVRGAPASK